MSDERKEHKAADEKKTTTVLMPVATKPVVDGIASVLLAHRDWPNPKEIGASYVDVPLDVIVPKATPLFEASATTSIPKGQQPPRADTLHLYSKMQQAHTLLGQCDQYIEALGLTLDLTSDLYDVASKDLCVRLMSINTASRHLLSKHQNPKYDNLSENDKQWLLIQGTCATVVSDMLSTTARYIQMLGAKYYDSQMHAPVQHKLMEPLVTLRSILQQIGEDTKCRRVTPAHNPTPNKLVNLILADTMLALLEKDIPKGFLWAIVERRNHLKTFRSADYIDGLDYRHYQFFLGSVDEALPQLKKHLEEVKTADRATNTPEWWEHVHRAYPGLYALD